MKVQSTTHEKQPALNTFYFRCCQMALYMTLYIWLPSLAIMPNHVRRTCGHITFIKIVPADADRVEMRF